MVGFGSEVHASGLALPMLRVAPGSSVDVEVLSNVPMHVGVHWLGRGLLCVGDGCPACLAADARARTFVIVGSRRKAAADDGPRGVWLCEIGTNRWPLEVRTDDEPSIAGVVLRLWRRKTRGVVFVDVLEESRETIRTPFLPHQLVSAVARVHGLPAMGALESLKGWEERVGLSARRLLREAIERQS